MDGRRLSEGAVKPKGVVRTTATVKEFVPSPVYKKSRVDVARSETFLDFDEWGVRLVARDDGVAYRFESKKPGRIRVDGETAGVTVPDGAARCWLNFTRDFGLEETVPEAMRVRDGATEESGPRRMVYLPLVYEAEGKTVAVTESDVCDYPVWNLVKGKGSSAFDALFAPWPKATHHVAEGASRKDRIVCEKGGRWVKADAFAPWLVETDGTRTFPWRVFILADEPAKLCEADIVWALAKPVAEGHDFSWVKPGKVAWDWWNAFDNKGDPDGCTTATYERFVDFAAWHGVEYVILDEGWSEKLDIWRFSQNVDVPHLIDYAKERGVGIILWMAWAQIVGDEARVAEHFAKLGAKGFKVDFMDRGDADCERFYWRFAEECRKNRMLVDYHGAHRPTGLSRAYPNVLNYEAVHGLEQMKWYDGSYDFMANDVRAFFLRMTAGPLDYTPGAMDNYPLGRYKGTNDNPGSLGTRARQMAMMVLYEAPLQMLCDAPTKYEKNTDCFAFMANVPTVWADTVAIGGTPDTFAAVARQARDGAWYAAAISDAEERDGSFDLSFLGDGEWTAEVFIDAPDADREPTHYVHETKTVRAGDALAFHLAPGGGCAARFSRMRRASGADCEALVSALLGRMTLEEKVGQLSFSALFDKPDFDETEVREAVRRGEVSGVIWGTAANPAKRNALQRLAVEGTRLGIPLIFARDNIHGAHLTFPIAPALAGAFEPELFERAQAVAARETRAEGVEWVFAPMCDTARDPRWGRVQETCGEDPYLNALCCAAQVRGLQGAKGGLSSMERVVSCPKHFVGYSAVTGGRDYQDSEVSEWQLRNLHLVPFRAAMKEAGAMTVMSAFNSLDGLPAVVNRRALTDILRGEWNFSGLVASDWGSIRELPAWGVAKDEGDAAAMALRAGNDLDLVGCVFISNLVAAVARGDVREVDVDRAVARVLRVKFAAGLFDNPYVDETLMDRVWAASRAENAAIARECVRKSAVLLKNEGDALPLDAGRLKCVALIGPFADDGNEMLGAWNGRGEPSTVVTLASALKDAMPGAVVEVVKGCDAGDGSATRTLEDGTVVADPHAADFVGLDIDRAVRAARDADVVVFTIGETKGLTGENQSRATLCATGRQQELFDAVAASGKPVIALVFAGRPLALNEVYDNAAAVLYCWQPGSEAGNGLVDLLLGRESPSARLTMGIPWSVGEVPCFYNRTASGRKNALDGYYVDVPKRTCRYPFGYGLTYSRFAYSDAVVDGDVVRATVKNVGDREAVETVQFYVRQLACREGWRPVRELRGFRRVTLKPGEAAEVSFRLTDDVLGYTRRDGRRVCDKGEYRLWIASDSNVDGEEGVVYEH